MKGVKHFVPILLSCMFVTSTSASGWDDDMLLALRSSGNNNYYEAPTVETVEEEPVYVSTTSAPNQIVIGDYDIDPVMIFVSLGGGVSYRGVTGVHPNGDDEVKSDGEIPPRKSLGYNVEVMCDIGLSKHLYLSAGVGFAKQSIADKFFPGNYMLNSKHILDMPLYIGHRISSKPCSFASISGGPRFVYGIEGKCKEYYDFYPVPESGVFEHDCYGGLYGKKRFSVGLGFEIQTVWKRLMIGWDFNIYPRSECEPRELYDGLYREFRRCRKNATIKIGCRVL